MNIRLKKKIQQRLIDLEQQAENIKNQIIELKEFKTIKDNLSKERLEVELTDTLKRIRHIQAANRRFTMFE